MGYFKRRRSGVTISLNAVEVAALRQVITETAELVGLPEEPADDQQWARDLGLGGVGEAGKPHDSADPIAARLFPAAYQGADDVDGAARDFRRFTEAELRAGKAAHAAALLDSLPSGGENGRGAGGKVVLDEEACSSWLGALNDARLALGTALDVDDTTEYERSSPEPAEPRAQRLLIYHWLGQLQASLLDALMS